MEHIAINCLSVFALACALGVVLSKNAVNGAMCLLLCLAAIAGLFVELHAYLLAFILILIYAGAVVALFLFIVMLLDMQGGQPWRFRGFQAVAGFIAAALLIVGLNMVAVHGRLAAGPPAPGGVGSSLKLYAYPLFTTYLLPVQVIGFLLLIAMLGVIVLSKRTGEAGEGK
jgi:NADH-quinone oxidoreductase subunit J